MLDKLRQFFSERIEPQDQENPEQKIQIAAAALMIELSKADFEQDSREYQRIEDMLATRFDVDKTTLTRLLALAEEEFEQNNALHPFTRLINEHFSDTQKYQLMESLWQVALADGSIDKHEEHLIRKIADLIYVPHQVFIRSKLEVLEKLKLS